MMLPSLLQLPLWVTFLLLTATSITKCGAVSQQNRQHDEARTATKTCSSNEKPCMSGMTLHQVDLPFQMSLFRYLDTMGFVDIMDDFDGTYASHQTQGFSFGIAGMVVTDTDNAKSDDDLSRSELQQLVVALSPSTPESNRDMRRVLVDGFDDLLLKLRESVLSNIKDDNHYFVSGNNMTLVSWKATTQEDTTIKQQELLDTHLFHHDDPDATHYLLLPLVLSSFDITISISGEDASLSSLDKVSLGTDRAFLVPKGTAHQLTTTSIAGSADHAAAAADENDEEDDVNLVLSVALRLEELSSPPGATLSHTNILQDYEQEPLPELTIAPIRWYRSGKGMGKGCHRIGLPSMLSSVILEYLNGIGMTKAIHHYLFTEPFERTKQSNKMLKFLSWDWYMERPRDFDSHDLLTFIPATKDAHVDALKALSDAGFDAVLDTVGQHFRWDGIAISHISAFATSEGDPDRLELDHVFENTDKAYNLIIPLVLGKHMDEPELDLHDPDDILVGKFKHNKNEGMLMGDYCRHSMRGMTNLRDTGEYHFYMSISIADVNATNAELVAPIYYLDGYPFHERDLTLEAAGTHWNKNDPSVKLPKRKA
jgi:hypothetical protein